LTTGVIGTAHLVRETNTLAYFGLALKTEKSFITWFPGWMSLLRKRDGYKRAFIILLIIAFQVLHSKHFFFVITHE
jgi:hypothetical protein